MNFAFKVTKNNKTIQKCRTHSARRFINHLRTINWQNRTLAVYLRVSYGKQEDNFNRKVRFCNDGWYERERDLWIAFNAFKEAG